LTTTVLFHRHSDIEASTWFSAPFVEYWVLLSDVTASFWCAEHADHREEAKATSLIIFVFSQPPRHFLMSYDRNVHRCVQLYH